MQTRHKILNRDARSLPEISDNSVQLIVTSPPYPMIEMWDEAFSSMAPSVQDSLDNGAGLLAFERMHQELDKVWQESYRILEPGCIACINIGDATRSIGGEFQIFSNHSRIIQGAMKIGFSVLPDIIWRKPTNFRALISFFILSA